MLNLAINRTKDKLKQLEQTNLNASDRKELLDDIQKQIHKAYQNISNIQYEIKMLDSNQRQVEYTSQLSQLRQQVNQYELNFNEMIKKFKYEI